MSLYKSQDLPDGSVVVSDDTNPNVDVILKAGQWQEIERLAESEQRHRLREFLAANGEEWARERGPDSPLGRGMEAGTPTTDHGGAPPTEG